MQQRKFYHPDFESKSKFEDKKKEFVAFRIQSDKLFQLKCKAQELGLDLSELIRRKLENDVDSN